MDSSPVETTRIGLLRSLSFSYTKDLCDYNNLLICHKESLYSSNDQSIMYRGLQSNFYMTTLKNYEVLFMRKKEFFIWQFLAKFRGFDNSLQILKTINDVEYEKYKLEFLRKDIYTFYLSNSDVGGLAIDCLNLLDNRILSLLKKIMGEKKFNVMVESDDCHSYLDVRYEVENRSFDKDEVRIFSSKEMVKEFEINEYW